MAGDVAVEISPSNGKIEEQRGVDTNPCHDLPHGGSVDCNGVKSVTIIEGSENGNGEEGADMTYVFVNGGGAVAESGDNGENCTKLAPGEEQCAENYAELKFNDKTKAGEANANGCNGHCYFEDVVVVGDGAVEVGNGKGKSDENGDHIMERNNLLVTEDFKGESDKLGPIEEVDGVHSAESEALRGANFEDKLKVESSFEVVERVPESQDNCVDDKGSIDCKEPLEKTEELPEPVDLTSEIVKPEPQAANDEATAGMTDCKGPEENTTELSEKVECTSEVVEVDSQFHRNSDGLCDIKESSKITEQPTLHVEPTSEVVKEVSNPRSVSHVDADCSYDSKNSLEHAVDWPEQVESTSDAAEEISDPHSVGDGDADVMGNCTELSEKIDEISAELSEQVAETQKSEVVVTDNTNSELAIDDTKEKKMFKGSKLHPVKAEKVEEPSQLKPNADLLENKESLKIHTDDASNDVVQEKSLVGMAAETTVDQLCNIDGDQDEITKPSACPEPYDIDTATSKSHAEIDHRLETNTVPHPVYMAKEDGDSIDASLDMKEQEAALDNAEILASSADCRNTPVQSVECPPTAEPTLAAPDANAAERYLAVADGISSPALDDREPAAELVAVIDANEPALEDVVGNADATSSAVAEMGSEGQDGSASVNDTLGSHCITESAETKICFGSINHEEISSISIEDRSFEDKSAVDAGVNQTSPDLKSPENDGNDKSMAQGTGHLDGVPQSDEVSHVEGSTTTVAEAQLPVPEMEKRFFNCLVRHPRYGEDLKEQINDAQAQVDEKTRRRDAVQAEIQMIKATRRGYFVELEAASAEEQSARDSLKSKWQEIDTVQSVVNKVKDAMSIDDFDHKIHSMEQKIEHETLPLKEEKQLLREIKQLKQFREQLSSNMGKQDELKEALEQKEQTEEGLKVMRKEVELLRGNVSGAEVVTKAVKKKLYDCNDKLRELQDQFKAADAMRQEAYQQLKSLRAQLREKNKYFYKYKNDAMISSELGSKGDPDGVSTFCLKQVEEFMELWSKDVEFRSEYIRCSLKGTLRRLGTKDGRSLGVDERPPAITPYPRERVVKDKYDPAFPNLEQAKARTAPVEAVPSTDNIPAKPTERKKQKSKAKAPTKQSEASILAASVFVSDFEVAAVIEGPKQTKEEEERARKEEKLRKEEEAARLKEQRRLEEKAKAEAALERKKRNAERAQARAAAKAQKEAEQKEKEREKRLKKKERKKAAGSTPVDAATEGEHAVSSPTLTEPETREKVEPAGKRPQRPTHFTKQSKVKSTVPPPLRNRGKRKMQPWMWVLLISAVVLALFLVGNGRQLI